MSQSTSNVLQCTVLGRSFTNPLMNAAGVLCSTKEELDTMAASAAGAQITKSCTEEFRQGNPEPRYSAAPYGTINSMGLPNLGFEFYKKYVEERVAAGTHKDKPLFFSVSGLSLQEAVRICKALSPLGAAGSVLLELNLSCPNVPGKPQVAYDWDDMEEYLSKVSEVYEAPFGVKMPPYFDIAHFDMAAKILNKHDKVSFVTCINSVGNGLVIDVEKESVVIKPKQGFGGLGGHYVLPTALANVNALYRRCPNKTIIGCGGVSSGEEVFMHLLAGASLVQVGSQLHLEGVAVFERLQKELEAVMARKGYKSIEEFRGKLKTMDE